MVRANEIIESILHLLFPHICPGCGTDNLSHKNILCLHCMASLPETFFEYYPDNPIEKKFYGRIPVQAATAQYFFSRSSILQRLVHQLKYNGNKEVGYQLGRLMGISLKKSARFNADAIVPVPLFAARERKRGYNQSLILSEGIAEELHLPILKNIISRPDHTQTQTLKGRIERWKNIEGKFRLVDPSSIAGKHILLVDDVITTGATLESCSSEFLRAGDITLSIACLCYADN
jgi:ComF family protein